MNFPPVTTFDDLDGLDHDQVVEGYASAERELSERPSRNEMVALVAAIIQDEAKYDPVTNTWDVEKAAADIVTAFETA